MKKISLTAAALLVAVQMSPLQAAPTDVGLLRAVQVAVDAGDAGAVKDLLAQHPELTTLDPVFAEQLNEFVATPRQNALLRALDRTSTAPGKASETISGIIASIY